MKKVKVLINFVRMSASAIVEYARNTVTHMTGNASFPTPDVALTQITTTANTLETKFNAAQGGGKQQTAEMHQARKALEDLLRRQVLYIERVTLGNEAMILSSGFSASRQPVPALHPNFVVANNEMSGEVILKHKAVKGARSWVWQYCPDPLTEGQWIHAGVSTQASFILKNLTEGKKYWFRAAYVAPAGQSEWCEPFVKLVV